MARTGYVWSRLRHLQTAGCPRHTPSAVGPRRPRPPFVTYPRETVMRGVDGGGTMTDMAQMICQFPDPHPAPDGVVYVVQAWAETDGSWHGWLVFIAADGRILRTGRETSQPDRASVRGWASGLRPVDLNTALLRAFPPSAERPAA